jgi:hypothetical protein
MPATSNSNLNSDLLYGLDNPDFAWRNALQDRGINPYAANPFTRKLSTLGQPLANAYTAKQAVSPYSSGSDIASGNTLSFGQYLQNEVGTAMNPNNRGAPTTYGGPTTDSPFNEIGSQAASFAPVNGIVQHVRDYRNGLNDGSINAANLNPFMAKLSDQLGANGGMGTADWLGQMYSPFMSSAVGSAYRSSLQNSGEQAIRSISQEPLNTPKDIWSYMLGI